MSEDDPTVMHAFNIGIKSPSFDMFCSNQEMEYVKRYYSRVYDKFSEISFDFHTLNLSFHQTTKFPFYEVLKDCELSLYDKIKDMWPNCIRKLPAQFKIERTAIVQTTEYFAIQEKWCKRIMDYLAYLYGFDHKNEYSKIPSIQMRIIIREISRIQRTTLIKMIIFIIHKFIERNKCAIHCQLSAMLELLYKEPTIYYTPCSYEESSKLIDSFFKPVSQPSHETHYNAKMFDNPKILSNFMCTYAKSFAELEKILTNTRPFYNILVEHLNLKSMNISFEDIQWRMYIENIYLENAFYSVFRLYTAERSKTNHMILIDKLSQEFTLKKENWNKKLALLTPQMKGKLAEKLMMNEDTLDFKYDDPVLNAISEIKRKRSEAETVIVAKKKKKRKRKKKANKKENALEDKSNDKDSDKITLGKQVNDEESSNDEDGEYIPEDIPKEDEKKLMVPNIDPIRILQLEKKFLEKLKSKGGQ